MSLTLFFVTHSRCLHTKPILFINKINSDLIFYISFRDFLLFPNIDGHGILTPASSFTVHDRNGTFIYFCADTWRLLKLMGLRSKQFGKKKIQLSLFIVSLLCIVCRVPLPIVKS